MAINPLQLWALKHLLRRPPLEMLLDEATGKHELEVLGYSVSAQLVSWPPTLKLDLSKLGTRLNPSHRLSTYATIVLIESRDSFDVGLEIKLLLESTDKEKASKHDIKNAIGKAIVATVASSHYCDTTFAPITKPEESVIATTKYRSIYPGDMNSKRVLLEEVQSLERLIRTIRFMLPYSGKSWNSECSKMASYEVGNSINTIALTEINLEFNPLGRDYPQLLSKKEVPEVFWQKDREVWSIPGEFQKSVFEIEEGLQIEVSPHYVPLVSIPEEDAMAPDHAEVKLYLPELLIRPKIKPEYCPGGVEYFTTLLIQRTANALNLEEVASWLKVLPDGSVINGMIEVSKRGFYELKERNKDAFTSPDEE
ncbi:hypothetical protein DRJ48_03670 [Candidatus Woesearchaeota archaeon]|nr:hypothetical protein [Candidatus Woesearchaeota archaeon]RLE42369.1 MAG: hypothetical protein DRJ48_03670 [Candidatus Woesearchaeota archaeon]